MDNDDSGDSFSPLSPFFVILIVQRQRNERHTTHIVQTTQLFHPTPAPHNMHRIYVVIHTSWRTDKKEEREN